MTSEDRSLVQCPKCNAMVRSDRLERHMHKVHLHTKIRRASINSQSGVDTEISTDHFFNELNSSGSKKKKYSMYDWNS